MSSLRNLLITSLLATSTAFAPQTTPLQRTSPLSVAVDTSDIKNGLTIELDGEPYKVMGFSIMKQARGAAKTTIKFKNLKRGTTIENTYRSGEKFETAEITRKPSQFTYEDDVSVFDALHVCMLFYCCFRLRLECVHINAAINI
jgi:hypothetical protein